MSEKKFVYNTEKTMRQTALLSPVLNFGDYAIIEQKRYGVENENYLHKVIGRGKSNTWVDVPVQTPAKETIHDDMEEVIRCVCCGVDERHILKYRASDVKPIINLKITEKWKKTEK